jgi:Rrf2 family protein
MQLGEGVEWALHAAVVLALVPPDSTLPASRLAEYHGVPPAYLAKHLQALSLAGIVESVPGRRGGYRLARPAGDVTVLDVVEAVEGTAPAFRCTEIRQRGPAAVARTHYRAPCTITKVMRAAEAAWRAELASVSVLDLVIDVAGAASPVAIRKSAHWMQEASR